MGGASNFNLNMRETAVLVSCRLPLLDEDWPTGGIKNKSDTHEKTVWQRKKIFGGAGPIARRTWQNSSSFLICVDENNGLTYEYCRHIVHALQNMPL